MELWLIAELLNGENYETRNLLEGVVPSHRRHLAPRDLRAGQHQLVLLRRTGGCGGGRTAAHGRERGDRGRSAGGTEHLVLPWSGSRNRWKVRRTHVPEDAAAESDRDEYIRNEAYGATGSVGRVCRPERRRRTRRVPYGARHLNPPSGAAGGSRGRGAAGV